MMISGDHLATVKIDRVIFHDVPSNKKHETGYQPTFSDVETPVDPTRKTLIRWLRDNDESGSDEVLQLAIHT